MNRRMARLNDVENRAVFDALLDGEPADRAGRIRSVLIVPRSELADFELAASGLEPGDLALLEMADDFGLITGDWRRSALRRMIDILRRSCHRCHGEVDDADRAYCKCLALYHADCLEKHGCCSDAHGEAKE